MSSSWTNKVEHVRDGEPVDSKTDSRPTRALESQARYLKDRVDGIENKEALVLYDSAIESDASVGMPVYWNGERSRFERALSEFTFNQETRIIETSPLCDVLGVVLYKHSAEVADILIYGKGSIDITDVIDDGSSLTAGRYFLSGKVKGKLSKKPAIADVAVLHADGNGSVYVQPQLRDGPFNHVHYEFELSLDPCGDSPTPAVDGRHSIINVDDSIKGWLPADHASFNGLAPTKAAFGYNLAAHQALNNVFPPMPAESCSVTLFKSESDGNGVELPMGELGLIHVDINGIWWMSDCYNDVPWAYQATSSSSASATSSMGNNPECPRETSRKLLLRFSRSSYGVDKTVVTSLDPIAGSGITILGCYDNKPANTGALKIGIDLGLAISGENELGSLVLKNIVANKFKRGRVIEGLKTGDNSITLSSTHNYVSNGDTIHQGIVTVSSSINATERLLQPQVVRLSDAKERYYQEIMYLALPPSQASSVRLKVLLPHADTLTASPSLKLRLRLLGRTTGTLPSLTATYRILSKTSGSPTSLPLSDSSLTISTSTAVDADEYIDIDSSAITSIQGQDIVFFTISRSNGDGYAGEVGIIEAVAVLT
jgi:hypothetical protein